ncbi:PAS domain-containing hybrid sensor histidine kinase/response regulator [Ectobacillus ponti]|uniref:histidine kinase n=1 Tax=Ectobacillus ponti TaxID=2961894 RepID=A0AA41XAJ2_9BACI|nr:PAS domain-containing hybrid sensor histidine kinase/response regulator [Ectobacillus ponti]MCP8969769.1 ATP-binding protein [Ectobacillus ponti]
MLYSNTVAHVSYKDSGLIFKCIRRGQEFIHTFCEGKMLHKLGLEPEQFVNRTLHDVFEPDVAEALLKNHQAAWQGQHVEMEGTLRGIPYVCYIRPVYDGGKVVEIIGTCIDMTERLKMQEEMQQAKEEAQKASIAKSEFLSKMSHELRTPLNAILGFAQLLDMQQLTAKPQEFVQEILGAGRHLLHLIDDVLDLSRIESGKLKVSLEAVSFSRLLQECLQIVSLQAEKKYILMDQHLNGHNDAVVLADPVRLKQVLLNLLNNAVKYNKMNGRVVVSLCAREGRLFVYVKDTGPGLPLDEQEKIFQPFYRIRGTEEDGVGIGLFLTKHLVDMMDGQMGVQSTPGAGSDFWFSLPLYQAEPAAGNEEHVEEAAAFYRVLYIEDNPRSLELVKNILLLEDSYTLLTATNGIEGLELARRQSVDIILLDMNLPDMHGYEVFEQLKADQRTCGIPVIAISANAMPGDIEQTLQKGFHTYLTKPIDVRGLLSVLESLRRGNRQ